MMDAPSLEKWQWKRLYWTVLNRRVWVEDKVTRNIGISSEAERDEAISEIADYDEIMLRIGAAIPDIQELPIKE